MSTSQPSRFAPSPSQSRPRTEFVFEPLLDSDEQRSCSASTQKHYSEWPATVRFTEFKLKNYGVSGLLISKGG
jgi:hypothetical protein